MAFFIFQCVQNLFSKSDSTLATFFPYSLSDDAKKLGRPENFDIHIREVYVSAGAGFVVALTGAIMTMPGLPKVPAANGIDVSEDGMITGLF